MWRLTISLLAAVFLLTACASTPTSSDSSSAAPPTAPTYGVRTAPDEFQSLTNEFTSPEDAARGKRQFDAKCSVCHGDNGEGDPDDPESVAFTDRAWMDTRSDGQLFYIISEGGGDVSNMEAFGAESDYALSKKKIWQIIAYIRTFSQGEG